MTNLIIMAVVLAVGFFTRKIWLGWIVSFFAKKKADRPLQVSTFQIPNGLKRTFIVAIDITEGGDGSALVEISKYKESKK